MLHNGFEAGPACCMEVAIEEGHGRAKRRRGCIDPCLVGALRSYQLIRFSLLVFRALQSVVQAHSPPLGGPETWPAGAPPGLY